MCQRSGQQSIAFIFIFYSSLEWRYRHNIRGVSDNFYNFIRSAYAPTAYSIPSTRGKFVLSLHTTAALRVTATSQQFYDHPLIKLIRLRDEWRADL